MRVCRGWLSGPLCLLLTFSPPAQGPLANKCQQRILPGCNTPRHGSGTHAARPIPTQPNATRTTPHKVTCNDPYVQTGINCRIRLVVRLECGQVNGARPSQVVDVGFGQRRARRARRGRGRGRRRRGRGGWGRGGRRRGGRGQGGRGRGRRRRGWRGRGWRWRGRRGRGRGWRRRGGRGRRLVKPTRLDVGRRRRGASPPVPPQWRRGRWWWRRGGGLRRRRRG